MKICKFEASKRYSYRILQVITLLIILWINPAIYGQVTNNNNESIIIVTFGDSLSAGYQLPPKAAFPNQLEAVLQARGHNVIIINASVSGDTASAGLARLDWSLPENTDGVILELGANDALRGINPEETYKALDEIIHRLKMKDIHVLIAGMRAPPNLGPEYEKRFNKIYPNLAQKYNVLLYSFFLDGVAAEAHLNLSDGIHPTEEGVKIIVDRILPSVETLLDKIAAKP